MALAVFFDQGDDAGEAGAHGFEHAGIGVELRLLRHVGNTGAVLHLQRAVIRPVHAAQNFEHAGFARAVTADQADALRGFEGEVSVVEQGNVPECQLGVK